MQNQQRANAGISDYPRILIEDIPLIDVRAPVEFQQGAMPCAINLPLMNDEERTAVGTCYKQQGRQAALEFGQQRVCGIVREQRIAAWRNACQRYPQGYICCARGGMRSHITQRWLHEAGIDYPLVNGGYKALRRMAIQAIDQLAQHPLILIGGCTGSGKTTMVKNQPAGVDLEALAQHRGSSFGRTVLPQPGQAGFEHLLAAAMLKISVRYAALPWILEDEGRMIGAVHLPASLSERMACAPIVVIEEPFERRLQRLTEEYFVQTLKDFQHYHGDETGWQHYADGLRHGLFAIRRRLGAQRYQQCSQYLEQALKIQQQHHSPEAHLNWLTPLLDHYYDPMYRYQLEKKAQNIVFRGDYQQVTDWLVEHSRCCVSEG